MSRRDKFFTLVMNDDEYSQIVRLAETQQRTKADAVRRAIGQAFQTMRQSVVSQEKQYVDKEVQHTT